MTMKPFNKSELKKVGLIFILLFLVSSINFRVSLRKSRDAQRSADLTLIKEKLEEFQSEVGYYPPASGDGRIMACKSEATVVNLEFKRLENPIVCKWGEDSLINYFSDTPKTILERIPGDPQGEDGVRYFYRSSQSRFQLYAALESKSEAEYKEKIASLKIKCGTRICNSGRAFSDTPLEKTIQEYENELLRR